VVIQAGGLLGGTIPPAGDGRLAMTEDAHGSTHTEALRQGAEHLTDA
jgi:hypothetical protein